MRISTNGLQQVKTAYSVVPPLLNGESWKRSSFPMLTCINLTEVTNPYSRCRGLSRGLPAGKR